MENFSFESAQVVIAVVVFLVCYALIISEKINRSIIALAGAVLMLVLGIVDLHVAYTKHIHWDVIFLLLGMMIMVGVTKKSGIFEYIAIKTAQSAKGDPLSIMVRLGIVTALCSAFVDNVTAVLVIAPIIIAISKTLHINPIPFLITQIIICNIGGAATLVGDPPNIMIGSAAGITFNQFLVHITPFIIVTVGITLFILKKVFGKQLKVEEKYKAELMKIDASEYLVNPKLVKRSLFAFGVTILGFLTHQFLNLEPAVIALAGALLIMLLTVREEEQVVDIYSKVEWVTIFFFAGLFVLVGGLVETGVITTLAVQMINLTGGDPAVTSLFLLWGAGIASAFVDNIPLVATMIPLVQDVTMQMDLTSVEVSTLWWSLALGACLGGNGTIIASSANLIIASIAHREGYPISFVKYFKYGFSITVFTLVLATVYIFVFFITLGLA